MWFDFNCFSAFQGRDHKINQLENDVKDYEEQITNLKTQVFQEQQKLFECESEWKENLAKQDTHSKSLKIEVQLLPVLINYDRLTVFKK